MTSNRTPYQHGNLGRCGDCEKVAFTSRKAAKRALRDMRAHQGMREYKCPCDPLLWHVGHLPQNVLLGRIQVNEAFGYRRVTLDD